MNKSNIVEFKSKKIMYVKTSDIPSDVPKAFEKLESHLLTLKGRKFYGAFFYNQGNPFYWACVEIKEGDNLNNPELEIGMLPAGKYATRKLKKWSDEKDIPKKIVGTFEEMSKEFEVDRERPEIEFYRSQSELILMMPVK
ncbi:MAG: GyrI-like domain-containing protein [candidate division Zixibacteria bacterium]|nr:GyrI-like domain-containing protein [candidate division Zixibacteria bacterium]